jgi:hypothetical protein
MKNLKRGLSTIKSLWWLYILFYAFYFYNCYYLNEKFDIDNYILLNIDNKFLISLIISSLNTIFISTFIGVIILIWNIIWKLCPFCGKKVYSYATVCEHCHSKLD